MRLSGQEISRYNLFLNLLPRSSLTVRHETFSQLMQSCNLRKNGLEDNATSGVLKDIPTHNASSLILVPGLFANPSQLNTSVCPDLDGGGLCRADRFFHGLHKVLRVTDQHVRGFLVFLRT
uniref:Uncharacterized protein n=1 Tax=Timema douglasi TaxID=61478 RepID=A0A7R8VGA4_TIMDO|nr:unnamed protein product [Timema douglasi]